MSVFKFISQTCFLLLLLALCIDGLMGHYKEDRVDF